MSDLPFCFLEDIKKTYRTGEIEVEVLKGINLEIKRGEFVAIMGTSGSGKTTLLNIIGCLDRPTSGRYLLAGREVFGGESNSSGLDDNELSEVRNKHIGFIFQNFYLLPYATVLENVLLPALYSDSRVNKTKAMEILRLVGLSERAKFKPNQLSGGQQQRVAIARALINEPELILADEPTGQLDSNTAREIMELLKELNKKGKTIILVTHDNNIAGYADKIIHMKDGRIVSVGD
jgi:putative ABC transport system ATP-binding protein